jgi:hypothetical protein
MPEKSRAELEAMCIEYLKRDPSTCGVTSVGLVKLNPEGSGPNWTIAEADADPPFTPYGWDRAREIVAGIAGTYAMADSLD